MSGALRFFESQAGIVGLLLGVLGIVATLAVWYYDRLPKKKELDVALVGLRAAGKTRLVWTWSKAEVIREVRPGATATRTIYTLARQSKVFGKKIVEPRYVFHDFGGEQPGQFIDEAVFRWFYALVLVVDHTALDVGAPPVDSNRIIKTVGYIEGLVRGYLQSQRSRMCQVVIIFINKSDMLSDSDRKAVLSMYKGAEGIMQSTGKNVYVFVGSAKEGLKVMDALAALDDHLLTPAVCNV